MGKFVDKKLAEMGGIRVHGLGLGDDDANIEDDFVQWKEAFWASVCQEFNLEVLGDDFSMRQYESKVKAVFDYHYRTRSSPSGEQLQKWTFSI